MTKQDLNLQEPIQKKGSSIENKEVKTLRPFGTSIDNFYVTDFICENSVTMAKASKVRIKNTLFKDKSIYN